MKNATAYAKKLRGLLRRCKAGDLAPTPHADPLDQLIYAFLLWETTQRQADLAYGRLMKQVVDHNDLRVSDPADIVKAIGDRYSRADERAVRLRSVLHAIYLGQHVMSLEAVKAMSKRDARSYLEGLEGMVPFVAASVVVHALGGHAIPVDEQLLSKLRRDGIVDEEASIVDVQAFLEHQIKAAEAQKAIAQLRSYAESGGGTSRAPASRTAVKSTSRAPAKSAKKTAKKSTKKTARSR